MSDVDITPRDVLEVAQRALAKVNELEREHEQLQERFVEVELRLSEIDDERGYAEYSLDEKVGLVREHAYRKARTQGGRTKLYYDDVMWGVFDGEPGPAHCYKLIRRAAGLDDEKTGGRTPGFRARDPENDSYHLAVDADRVKDGVAFFSENKTSSEGVAK